MTRFFTSLLQAYWFHVFRACTEYENLTVFKKLKPSLAVSS